MKCVLAAMGILTVTGLCASVLGEEKMQSKNDENVVLENNVLKVTVSPIGARIISLIDKERRREEVKNLPEAGGMNTIRLNRTLNIDERKDRYDLKLVKLPDGTQKLLAVAKVQATEDKPGVATVTKEYSLSPGSSCLQLALELRNEGSDEIALIPWVHNMVMRGSKEKEAPEEAHMTEFGAFISDKPHPGKRENSVIRKDDPHYFPAGNWSSQAVLPIDESANTLAIVTRPEDMFKLYNWYRGVDFTTLEVIAQPFFAQPGKSFRWEYFMLFTTPVRNIVYASPELVIGVSPHPTWLVPDTKELTLDFTATHDLSELKAHVRLVAVNQPDKAIQENDFTLAKLSSRSVSQHKLAVSLQDGGAYQLRLTFTLNGKPYIPGAAVGDRPEVIIPLVVGKQEHVPVVFPKLNQEQSRLRQIQPQVRQAKQVFSCDAFDAFSYPSSQRVFRKDSFQSTGKSPLLLNACAGEYESLQLVLTPKSKNDIAYQVTGTELVGPDGSKVSCESINDFIYVPTRTPSLYNANYRVGEYPEALLPVKQTTLKPDGNHPLFITWRIPQNAKPGIYRGSVSLTQGAVRHEIPVEMKVWNIQIPVRSHYMEFASSLKGNTLTEARHADGKPFTAKEQLDAIVDMHLKYRLTPCDSGLGSLLLNGKYAEFEKEMKKFVDDGATKIFLGQIPSLLKTYGDKLPEIEKYLKEKGWSDYFYVRPGFDEVASDQVLKVKAVLQDWKKVSSIPTMETYYHDDGAPELFGLLDIWSRSFPASGMPAWCKERVKAGDRFWKVNAMPGLLEDEPWTAGRARYIGLWDVGVTGSYNWTVKFWGGVTKWGEDYWVDAGVGNLSATLMWPHETGILSTIRLEAMRDGLEDNAMFWMLREKVEALKGKTLSDPAQAAALADARTLCSGEMLVPKIKSVEDLERLRNRVGEALSILNGIQTK